MSRIQQLQSRIDRVMGNPLSNDLTLPATSSMMEGRTDLSGAAQPDSPSPLKGNIGAGASAETIANVTPMNPFGSYARVSGVDRAPSSLQGLIASAANEAGINPLLLEALVGVESDYNPTLVSDKGAKGLAQLMPNTAAALGVKDAFDPGQNLRGGAKYLSQMLKQFNGDERLALAAYNAGPGAVARAGGIPVYPETQKYVGKVMARYHEMRGR